jgi:Xaa-Pro aminopeptidase
MADDQIQRARDDLISRFEEGLMLASDKQHILDLLRSQLGHHMLDCLLAGARPDDAYPEIGTALTQAECVNRFEKTDAGVIDWKMEAERANRLYAQLEATAHAATAEGYELGINSSEISLKQEIEALKHDSERHVEIVVQLTNAVEQLRSRIERQRRVIRETLLVAKQEWDFPGAPPRTVAVLRDLEAAVSSTE